MSGMRPNQTLRIGWVGFHQEGLPALAWLRQAGIRLEAIFTLDEPSLARRSASGSYDELLEGWDVPLHRVASVNDPSTVQILQGLELDLLFVIGWSQILHAEALAAARIGVIGAHASLLPHNRGSAPINWAVIRNENITGNSLIWLTEEVDEGRIIDQIAFPITPFDTCATLYNKVADSNRVMIERVLLKLLAGEIPGTVQSAIDEPILPRRRPADGLINWSATSEGIYNFVRALTRPYPGAFSFMDGVRWTIQSSALLPGGLPAARSGFKAGTIVGPCFSPINDACGIVVQCGEGQILLLELERSDGNRLRGPELSLGATDSSGRSGWTGRIWSNE